ncbi:MAG: aminotransferase class I/II-fold pyridoxal phosphate-dependent enzyme [Candidatus Poseidoniaceae archaeon]|nr:aminotransferase class I/II-fold pyridoxal phosphate-dependent enzyme [Candidatus Poseidoniaceae archaeon]MBL6895932.1 aminotransferase class I/II-fold pyridoxal phosphate-dependent enzyme [Candidatus Poseidoniaceae archaeon]
MREYNSDRIDMRSDTVTQPTKAMLEAMMAAKVGDDVLQDDPTVKALEARIAEICGMDSALFVPSGTMSNAVAIRAHTSPGDEIVMERTSHIYQYEGGGYAVMSGVSVALVDGNKGQLTPELLSKAIRKAEGSLGHYPDGTLVCVENTANRGGGTCYTQENLDAVAKTAHEHGCQVHMDGARIFNASIKTNTPVSRMLKEFDSVSICLSKGLGAPVGSLLVGSADFIAKASRWRKMFGGGMRQSGILAAAGMYALDNNIQRLSEDHSRAKRLATALNEMDEYSVDLNSVETNMVYIDSKMGAKELMARLSSHAIDVLDVGPTAVRAVTHLHVTDEDIDKAIEVFRTISA